MKVVISSYTFLPEIGGVATNVSVLAKGFADAGHDVTLVTTAPGPSEGFGFRVVRRPKPRELFSLYVGADLLLLSNLSVKLLYPLAVLRRRFGLRHHSESAFALSSRRFSADAFRRSIVGRAVNFTTSAYIGRRSGLERYTVVHPFANPAHINPAIAASASERRHALFVGRLEEEKGVLYLLDRWPEVRRRLGVDELRIAGDGALRAEVERRIAQGEADGVRYLGRLPLSETAAEMGRAVYLLTPSLWAEPFGAVAIEGLAAGAITILTDRGGLTETTGELGFFFDPDNAESFSAALDAARATFDRHLASPEARAQYEAAVAAHIARFTPAAAVEKIIAAMAP